MPNPLTVARDRAVLLAAAATLTGALVGGCDLQEDADLERGRALFSDNCGTCHALTEARQNATVGPDLDAAFAAARETGMDQDTIEGVVQDQIANPRKIREDSPHYGNVYMPANIVTGRDAEDVAAYVASVAGVPGIEPPELGDGQEIFSDLCSSCHTLAEANASGTTGPNLDEVLPGQSAKQIAEAIRNPEAQIAQGFPAGVMPVFDVNQLPEENFQDLLDYLLQNTGNAGGGG